MKKDVLQAFATRVTQANKTELVVIIYEAALASIEEGRKALHAGAIPEARREIGSARDLIAELMRSLDMKYNISTYLMELYRFGHRELCNAMAYRDTKHLDNAAHILEGILPSFKELAKQDESGPVMQNSQTIVAGLTYGPGSDLRETIGVGIGSSRGFQA